MRHKKAAAAGIFISLGIFISHRRLIILMNIYLTIFEFHTWTLHCDRISNIFEHNDLFRHMYFMTVKGKLKDGPFSEEKIFILRDIQNESSFRRDTNPRQLKERALYRYGHKISVYQVLIHLLTSQSTIRTVQND